MPIKGLEKGDGVPSSPCGLRRDKLGKRERTFPQKGFSLFPKSPISTFIGNRAIKKRPLLDCLGDFPLIYLIGNIINFVKLKW